MKKIDATGLKCPMPVVRLAKEVKGLASGDEVEVIATDSAFAEDAKAWCRITGHTLEALVQRDGVTSVRIRIK